MQRDTRGRYYGVTVTSDCPLGQTYCNEHALGAKDCPLCGPYLQGKSPANYPVPATIGQVYITKYAVYFVNPAWIGTTLTINWRGEWHN